MHSSLESTLHSMQSNFIHRQMTLYLLASPGTSCFLAKDPTPSAAITTSPWNFAWPDGVSAVTVTPDSSCSRRDTLWLNLTVPSGKALISSLWRSLQCILQRSKGTQAGASADLSACYTRMDKCSMGGWAKHAISASMQEVVHCQKAVHVSHFSNGSLHTAWQNKVRFYRQIKSSRQQWYQLKPLYQVGLAIAA